MIPVEGRELKRTIWVSYGGRAGAGRAVVGGRGSELMNCVSNLVYFFSIAAILQSYDISPFCVEHLAHADKQNTSIHTHSLTHARLHKYTDKQKEIYWTIKHKWSKENIKNTLSMNTRIKKKHRTRDFDGPSHFATFPFPSLSVSSLRSLVHLYTILFSLWSLPLMFLSWAVGKRNFHCFNQDGKRWQTWERQNKRQMTREKKGAQSRNKQGTSERDSTVESTVYIHAHTLSIRSIRCDCLYRSEIKGKLKFFFNIKSQKENNVNIWIKGPNSFSSFFIHENRNFCKIFSLCVNCFVITAATCLGA